MNDADRSEMQKAIDDALAGASEQMQTVAADAVKLTMATAVADALKPVADRLAKAEELLAAKPADKADDGKGGKVISLDDVRAELNAREKTAAEAAAKTGADAAARGAADKYAAEKMKDLPAAYRAKLPATADAAELAKAEAAIRAEAIAEAKAAGWIVPNVGTQTDPKAGPGGAAPDVSTMSPVQKIAAGVSAGAGA